MVQVSQKSRYALRALFELARRHGQGPVTIDDIAQRQAIPPRFLAAILNQLKQAGLLHSIRGAKGGYELARRPAELTVGEMMRVTEGGIAPTGCVDDNPEGCPLYPDCAFLPLWCRAADAIANVYDNTTFSDLLEENKRRQEAQSPTYVI